MWIKPEINYTNKRHPYGRGVHCTNTVACSGEVVRDYNGASLVAISFGERARHKGKIICYKSQQARQPCKWWECEL